MKKKETRYKNNWFYLQFFFFFFFCCNCTLAIFSCQEKKIWSRWWCQYGYPWNLMFILCRNHFSVLEGPLTIKNKCFQSIIYTHKTLENPLLKSFTIIIMIGDGAIAVSGKSLGKCYKTWTLGCAKFSLIYLL